jgi:hypothetical protein
MSSGHVGVFARAKGPSYRGELRPGWKGRPELPIVELRGPSIYRVWKKHQATGMARANEQLRKNLTHEFRYVLGQTSAPPAA